MSHCIPARRPIARGPMCSIEECACGVLHVTLGVLTIRLDRDVVASIWETFGEALRTLALARSKTGAVRASSSERPS